ncbi:MAG: hypothetical protein ONB46_11725 [candidate division KSB1 bacterium]|nr:hypothetical protein [candidate division KSB1 bacterium]MDZ7366663.1 hypothetical protein [candidate division KSB1 bacterium]MDZ7404673.1 hypothetical protein [candidate division KSB1 bacterium]
MPIAIKIPPVLRQVFNTDEKESAFIDVLNQIDAAQRNGYERSLEVHLQAFREWIDRRFEVATEKQKLALQESNESQKLALQEVEQRRQQAAQELKLYVNQLIGEADVKNAKRFAETREDFGKRFNETDVNNEKRFSELKVEIEKRFGELEIKSAQRQASQMKWMVTFFIGLLFTLVGSMFTYLQLMGKP